MPHGNTSRQQRAIKRVEMTGWLTAIAIVSFTVNGLAQGTTHTFFFDNDLKQYSIETVPNYDAYAMAGTYAVTPGFSGIHFVYYDPAAGGIVTSKVFYIPNRDIRPVDITVVDDTSFFITALMRDNLVSNGKDRIKVLKVNNQGTILMSAVLESAVSTSTGYRNMYPLHSIYLDNQLYICGYVGRGFYESHLGTGAIGGNPNNYRDLGGGISNIAWNPAFATRQTAFDVTSDIMMTAPVFNLRKAALQELLFCFIKKHFT